MPKQFAPSVPRDENGWLRFPSDSKLRDDLWPESIIRQPAKFNCFLVSALTEYLTEPGQTILDPMAGTGTTMMAAVMGRKVICIEVEPGYHEMQRYALGKLAAMDIETADRITLLLGDCRKFIPLPVDCIIFSPPYTNIMKTKQLSDFAATVQPDIQEYSSSQWNISNYNYFMYLQVMEKIYDQLALSAKKMAVVIKDHIEDQQRVMLVDDSIKMASRGGWKVKERHKQFMSGSAFTKLYRSRGMETVDDEDIIILESRRSDWLSRGKK